MGRRRCPCVMEIKQNDLWHEGFKAGFLFGSRCPYPAGSAEAETWEAGWAVAVSKREGMSPDKPKGTIQRLLKTFRLTS